jgi:hypothetical protein
MCVEEKSSKPLIHQNSVRETNLRIVNCVYTPSVSQSKIYSVKIVENTFFYLFVRYCLWECLETKAIYITKEKQNIKLFRLLHEKFGGEKQ